MLPKAQVSDQEKIELSKIIPQETGDRQQQAGNAVAKTLLINKLNYINFQDGTLLINFKHRKYDKTVTRLAKPKPCLGDTLDCGWTKSDNLSHLKNYYQFTNLLLIDGNKLLLVEPELIRLDNDGIRLLLPEICYEISSRTTMRHLCEGISVQLIQHSSIFSGKLLQIMATEISICNSAIC